MKSIIEKIKESESNKLISHNSGSNGNSNDD